MSQSSNLSIIATSFRETTSGRRLSGTKTRTEYYILVNHHETVVIEVSNSRLSRKKHITMNGSIVEKFNKTRTKDLTYNWVHRVDGMDLDFKVVPNASKTGTDLLIQGRDFFDYVIAVDPDGPDPLRPYNGSFNSFMKFKVPSDKVQYTNTVKPEPSPLLLQVKQPFQDGSLHQPPFEEKRFSVKQIRAKSSLDISSDVAISPDIDKDEDLKKLLGSREDLIRL